MVINSNGNITLNHNATFGGGITMGGQQINMGNGNIVNVNNLTFNDPGGGEGINWNGGNLWKIYESPNDLSNAAGNLQFVKNTTRLMTLDTSGNLEILGKLKVVSDTGIEIRNDTSGAGSKINFSDQLPTDTQQGTLAFYHSDTDSVGSGASFHFTSTESQLSIVAGSAGTTGKFYSYPQADAGEVDFGWANDTDTGMYRPAANQLGLVAGGSRKLLVRDSGVQVQNGTLIVTSVGSATSPAIQVGDTDSGFYDSGANEISVALGGVQKAIFNPSRFTVNGELYNHGRTIGKRVNYATPQGWTVADPISSQTGYYGYNFNANGSSTENKTEIGYDHVGNRTILWTAEDNDTGSNADGGWNKDISNLPSNDLGYLSVVYVKRNTSSTSGSFYHGCSGSNTLNRSNNSANGNPYFHSFNISKLPEDVWCLSIGYIQANNDSNTANLSKSGVYRLDTGEKIHNGTSFKMGTHADKIQRHRTFLYYSTDPSASLSWCHPGFYAIDGTEPSLAELKGTDQTNFWKQKWQ